MVKSAKKIRKTTNSSGVDRVRSVPLNHPALRELGVLVAACGIDERAPGSRWGERTGGTALLFHVVVGRSELEGHRLAASAGDVLVIPPRCDRFFMAGDEGALAAWVHLRPDAFGPAMSHDTPAVANDPAANLIYQVIDALVVESISPAGDSPETVAELGRLLHHYLSRRLRVPGSRDREMIERLSLLWNEVAGALGQPWTIARLSEVVSMSPSHFHREVHRLQGCSPMAMVKRLRMERATTLLTTTPDDLTAIARRVGYGTAYAFSNAFLKHTGVRPGAYRRARSAGQA